MANHTATNKSIRKRKNQTVVNGNRISRIRSFYKSVETAIAGGDKTKADAALREAQPEIMRGVTKGVLKLSTASRKISRFSKRIKTLAA